MMHISEQKINNDSAPRIQTGDVIIVKSKTGMVSKAIKLLSGSDFVHSAILIEIKGLWFVIEARYSKNFSYQMMPIEWWLTRYSGQEAFIGKMPVKNVTTNTRERIRDIVLNSDESLRPYKVRWLALVYFLQEWIGIFRPEVFKLFGKNKPLVCSTLVQEAWERAGVVSRTNYMTPGDLVNKIGGEKALIPLKTTRFIFQSQLHKFRTHNNRSVDIKSDEYNKADRQQHNLADEPNCYLN